MFKYYLGLYEKGFYEGGVSGNKNLKEGKFLKGEKDIALFQYSNHDQLYERIVKLEGKNRELEMMLEKGEDRFRIALRQLHVFAANVD